MSFEFIDNLTSKAPQCIESPFVILTNMTKPTKSLLPSFHIQFNQGPLLVNNHPMLTRAKIGKSKPEAFLAPYEPTTTKQDITQPEWFKAT